jgi:hypothetical protein
MTQHVHPVSVRSQGRFGYFELRIEFPVDGMRCGQNAILTRCSIRTWAYLSLLKI